VPAIARVLRAASEASDPRVAARNVALVSLYADWALRASEPLGLTLGDVECDAAGHPVAVWVRGKGRADRERFTLPSATAAALADWLVVRATLADHGPALDGSLRGATGCGRGAARGRPAAAVCRARPGGRPPGGTHADVRRGAAVAACRQLPRRTARDARGLARLTPHMLRHTAITAVLDAGASIREAQRFSRHRDPRVLLRYDDNREDLGGRRAAELSASPRSALK
jgi:integrase/recombinase XerC